MGRLARVDSPAHTTVDAVPAPWAGKPAKTVKPTGAVDALDPPVASGPTASGPSQELLKISQELSAVWDGTPPLWNPNIAPNNPGPGPFQTPEARRTLLYTLKNMKQAFEKSGLALRADLSPRDLRIRSSILQTFELAHLMRETQYDIWGSLQPMATPHDALQSVSISKPEDVEPAVKALETYPAYYQAWINALEASRAEGWVISKAIIEPMKTRIAADLAQIDAKLDETPYMQPLVTCPAGFSVDQYAAAKGQLTAAVQGPVRQSVELLSNFLGQYEARDSVGISEMPNPRAKEAAKLIFNYNLGKTINPTELHQLGLDQVEAAKANAIKLARTFVPANVPDEQVLAAFAALPQNRFASPEEVTAAVKAQVDKFVAAWTVAFGLKPEHITPPTLTASSHVTQGAYRRGTNEFLYNPDPALITRSDVPELVAHEIAHWANQMVKAENLPELAQGMYCYVTSEGVGIFAEQLAAQTGKDATHPYGAYDEFGYIGAEIALAFRAARVVCDTGIHFMGWSLDDSAKFLRAATGYSAELASRESVRYASMPGQADTYLVGLEGIQAARVAAKAKLGSSVTEEQLRERLLELAGVPLGTLLKGLSQPFTLGTP